MYVDDLAEACLFLMLNHNESGLVNVGVGEDLSIFDLAAKISALVGYEGKTVWDSTKPDGTPKKLMDVSKLTGLGWKASTSLEAGLQKVYETLKEHIW
jgi:GDP-L-fucose synthase